MLFKVSSVMDRRSESQQFDIHPLHSLLTHGKFLMRSEKYRTADRLIEILIR